MMFWWFLSAGHLNLSHSKYIQSRHQDVTIVETFVIHTLIKMKLITIPKKISQNGPEGCYVITNAVVGH